MLNKVIEHDFDITLLLVMLQTSILLIDQIMSIIFFKPSMINVIIKRSSYEFC